jgi:hypothetical protein
LGRGGLSSGAGWLIETGSDPGKLSSSALSSFWSVFRFSTSVWLSFVMRFSSWRTQRSSLTGQLGRGLAPPGVPAGTRSGFGLPVEPPFAPYGEPSPGAAIGAWPVVVLGSLVCGCPTVGCPGLASCSGTRVFCAYAVVLRIAAPATAMMNSFIEWFSSGRSSPLIQRASADKVPVTVSGLCPGGPTQRQIPFREVAQWRTWRLTASQTRC